MRQRQWKTTNVEVFVVISPPSGKDPTSFRVAMREWQYKDVLLNPSYAEEVFDAFRTFACEGLKLDPQKCDIAVDLEPQPDSENTPVGTGDVILGSLFLH